MPTSDQKWTWQCDRVIPNDTAVGRQLLEELLGQLESQHWGRRDIFGIHLAIDEALVNAILHGNALDEAKHVRFCCWLSPEKIRVEIIDEGPGFDPRSLPDPTDPAHIHAPGGRGVMLMRSFMSRIEFHDRGNHVVLEKVRGGLNDCGRKCSG
jgi:serine/threonine-protein kinase RsbW